MEKNPVIEHVENAIDEIRAAQGILMAQRVDEESSSKSEYLVRDETATVELLMNYLQNVVDELYIFVKPFSENGLTIKSSRAF